MSYIAQIGLREVYSLSMLGIVKLLDYALIGCVGVSLFVFLMLVHVLAGKTIRLYYWSGNRLELLWTLVPVVILIGLAVPSLHLLYVLNDSRDPKVDVKVTGRQWYWDYEVINKE